MKRNTTAPSEHFDFVGEKQFPFNSINDRLLNTRKSTLNALNTSRY